MIAPFSFFKTRSRAETARAGLGLASGRYHVGSEPHPPSPFLKRSPEVDNLDEYARLIDERSDFRDLRRWERRCSELAEPCSSRPRPKALSSEMQFAYVSSNALMLSPNDMV